MRGFAPRATIRGPITIAMIGPSPNIWARWLQLLFSSGFR